MGRENKTPFQRNFPFVGSEILPILGLVFSNYAMYYHFYHFIFEPAEPWINAFALGPTSPGRLWSADCHSDHSAAGLRGPGHLHREAQGSQRAPGWTSLHTCRRHFVVDLAI